jgi:hypothetical protein
LWPLVPVRPPSYAFASAIFGQEIALAPSNAARYAPYMAAVRAASPQLVVQAHWLLYPLLQQQYEMLGFPGRSFNTQVIATLDDLLRRSPVALSPSCVAA